MAHTNEVIGYVVQSNETAEFVHRDGEGNFLSESEPAPIARGDAYRRLAAFLDENPDCDENFTVVAIYRQTTPIEDAASELGGLFESLCARHGLDLGLSRAQVNALLVKDLEQVKNLGFVVGIPGVRR